jgi:hypothetical protein
MRVDTVLLKASSCIAKLCACPSGADDKDFSSAMSPRGWAQIDRQQAAPWHLFFSSAICVGIKRGTQAIEQAKSYMTTHSLAGYMKTPAHIQFAARRLKSRAPHAKLLLGLWSAENDKAAAGLPRAPRSHG